MSKRNFLASSRIEQGLGFFHRLPEIGVRDRRFDHEVHPPLEQLLQRLQQAEIAVGVSGSNGRLKLYQQVQVAFAGVKRLRGGRPEEFQPPDPMPPAERFQLLAMLLDYIAAPWSRGSAGVEKGPPRRPHHYLRGPPLAANWYECCTCSDMRATSRSFPHPPREKRGFLFLGEHPQAPGRMASPPAPPMSDPEH